MSKKWMAAALTAAMLAGLAACDNGPGVQVYVENVGVLTGTGSIAVNDKFAGIVVSENVTKIERDSERTIAALYAEEGADVSEGDVLFAYDSDELQLALDKQRLELEEMKNTSTTLKSQIADLQKDEKKASKDEKLQYTIEIQSKQADLKENEYKIKLKEKEIAKAQTDLGNAEILSPVSGRIVSISENGTDNYGNPLPYITIQQSGSYRVKGTLNELNRGAIVEGTKILVTSRTDSTQTWSGTVSSIDLESASQGNSTDAMYGMPTNEMTSSSQYPFYVELDSIDGLMLGQHVYLQVNQGGSTMGSGIWLPAYYICFEETEEGQEQGQAYVWAANGKDRLEKRNVTLGGYDEATSSYEILEGLTEEDAIAVPDENCAPGVAVTYERPEETTPLDTSGGEPDQGGDAVDPGVNNGVDEPDGGGGLQDDPVGGDPNGAAPMPTLGNADGTASDGNLPGHSDGTASGSDLGG